MVNLQTSQNWPPIQGGQSQYVSVQDPSNTWHIPPLRQLLVASHGLETLRNEM